MSDSVECAVIGAGVVGLAVARELARAGFETVVLESTRHIGTATSSRNSEVIHAGIYYPPASNKAAWCVAGKHQLYKYCEDHGVDFRRCGKLIVAASDADIAKLDAIIANAESSGVDDLKKLSSKEARALEPELDCVAAVLSPSTGIIDSHGLMLSLQGDLESAGGMIAFESRVGGGVARDGYIVLEVGGQSPVELRAGHVVNCGGLEAHRIAAGIDGVRPDSIPVVHYAKGNYYSLDCSAPFSRLIYPVPEDGGLGVHLTLDLGGRARFGPDVEWVDVVEYSVDPSRADSFYDAIRRYWPALPEDCLSPAYAGIRPKLSGPGEAAADFCMQSTAEHGVRGLINLYGIESPGLTASLEIARQVSKRLLAR